MDTRIYWKLGISLTLTFIGIILIVTSNSIQKFIIRTNMMLSPGSSAFMESWEHVPALLPMDFYFLNWTNPNDIYNASVKPKFQEVGPYRFLMDIRKVNITWNNNGTVTYKMQKFWHFSQEGTRGSLQDVVTTINVPTLAAAHMAQNWNYFLKKGLSFTISSHISQLHATHTVDDFLFTGYPDSFTKMGKDLPMFSSSDAPKWDRFGFFYMRNGSLVFEGAYNVGTGENSDLSKTYSWNYMSKTPFYEGECGEVRGSSGEQFDASGDTIEMYLPDLCKPLILEYVGDVEVEGIRGKKYVVDKQALDNGTEIPNNKCFCPGECMPSGVFNMTACRYGSPAFLSLPHFYKADPYYNNMVEGLHPEKKKHEFVIVLEPVTGVPLLVNVRLQFNMLLHPVSSITMYEQVPTIYFPIVWFDQQAVIPESKLSNFKLLLKVPTALVLCGAAISIVGFSLMIFFYLKRNKKKPFYKNPNEEVPLNKPR